MTCPLPFYRCQGFSLLEAIVAMVILSLTFASVWQWFGVAVLSTQRVQEAISMPDVFERFQTQLDLLSLQQQRRGVIRVEPYEVKWEATVVRQSDTQAYRKQPAWVVALFTIRAEVMHQGRTVTTFETQKADYWPDPLYIPEPSLSL